MLLRSNSLSDKPEDVEPGHGAKGKHRWLVEDEDFWETCMNSIKGRRKYCCGLTLVMVLNESIGCRKRRSEDEGGPVTSKSRKDTADTIT